MEQKIIAGKKFNLSLTLRQDELLAPIVTEMLKEIPDAFAHAGEQTIGLLANFTRSQEIMGDLTSGKLEQIDLKEVRETILAMQKATVSVAMDMIKATAWIYSKGYASKMMAILLVPENAKFDETKISELAKFFAENADREKANEVVNFFFQRSGVFGIGTQAFLQKAATK
jgi:hypothetical protein